MNTATVNGSQQKLRHRLLELVLDVLGFIVEKRWLLHSLVLALGLGLTWEYIIPFLDVSILWMPAALVFNFVVWAAMDGKEFKDDPVNRLCGVCLLIGLVIAVYALITSGFNGLLAAILLVGFVVPAVGVGRRLLRI